MNEKQKKMTNRKLKTLLKNKNMKENQKITTQRRFIQRRVCLITNLLKFLFVVRTKQVPPTLYQMTASFVTSGYFRCDPNKITFYSIKLAQPTGDPVSLKLKTTTIPPNRQYITDTDGNKRYGYYEFDASGTCYYHQDTSGKNTHPLVALAVTHNGMTSNDNCKVIGFVTNIGLVPCGGTTTIDIFEALELQLFHKDPGPPSGFKRVAIKQNNLRFWGYYAVMLEFFNFGVTDIDDRVLESLLMVPIHKSSTAQPISLLDFESATSLNYQYQRNTAFVKKIEPGKVVLRLVEDDLPGYYLGIYNGDPEDSSKVAQKVLYKFQPKAVSQTGAVHAELYIQRPVNLEVGETHAIEFTSKGLKIHSYDVTFKDFSYRIEVARTAISLEFKIKRDGILVPELNLNKPYTGQNKFIYFSFTIGGGYLYQIDATTVRAKYYEIFHVFEVGETVLWAVNSFEENANPNSVIPYSTSAGTLSHLRWVQIEYKPHPGVTTNKAGFRALILTLTDGIYPPFLIASVDNSAWSRCYFSGIKTNDCLASAHLSGPDEAQTIQYRQGDGVMSETAAGTMRSSCRVSYSPDKCLTMMPGYIINIEVWLRTPIPNSGVATQEEFNNFNSKIRNSFAVITSNLGTKYMVSCPYSCETCGTDLKCTTCPDGSNPLPDGSCSISACSSISNFGKCSLGGKCLWCTKQILQPDNMACLSGCPASSGYPGLGNEYECLPCVSPKCNKCTQYDTCEECKDSSHKFLVKAHEKRLPTTQHLLGLKDCFSPGDLPDYFYSDATDFIPCKENCKRCTNTNDCQVCGNHLNPTTTYYMLHNVSPTICVDEANCQPNLHRFIVPGATVPTCHLCPSDQYYTEGSNPPVCSLCNSGAVWKESSTRLCRPCGQGCALCADVSSCQSCVDSANFIQTDGGTCAVGCNAREMEKSGSPKRCEGCPSGCQSCSEGTGCTLCDDGYYKDSNNNCNKCPQGCGSCLSEKECLRCSEPNHLLKDKQYQTCTQHCVECDSSNKCKRCSEGRFLDKNNKECVLCSGTCLDCQANGCVKCQEGMIIEDGFCKPCPIDCKTCEEGRCKECVDGKGLINNTCQVCSKHCLDCNKEGCVDCKANLALYNTKCHTARLVDYFISQFYDPKSKETFNLRLTLQDIQGLSSKTAEEFSKSLLQHEDKLEVAIPSLPSGNQLKFTQGSDINEFILRIISKDTTNLSVGTKLNLTIKTFSRTLDPQRTGLPSLYILSQKSQTFEVEIYKLTPKELTPTAKSVAQISGATSSVVSPATIGLGLAFTVFSNEPNGHFLKFNQFLSLMRKIRLIGMFFGSSLKDFIELLCGGSSEGQSDKGAEKRILEISLSENQQSLIRQESKGNHNKLDSLKQTLFLEGMFMVKSFIFSGSWIFKFFGLYFFEKLKREKKMKKWVLNFLKYHRKVHFGVMMAAAMDMYFFGTRILLHRKDTTISILVKFYCGINMSLLTYDLMEVCAISLGLCYEEKEEKLQEAKTTPKTLQNGGQEHEIKDSKNNIFGRFKHNRVHSRMNRILKKPPENVRNESRGNLMENKSKTTTTTQKKEQSHEGSDLSIDQLFQEKSKLRNKLFIDWERTIAYNKRNLEIEKFNRKYIKGDPECFTSSLCLLSNTLNVLHLALMQISIVALPNSPTVLLTLLITLEVLSVSLTLIPYIFHHRFLPAVELLNKTIKSVCLIGFFSVCLIINLSSSPRVDLPVSDFLQTWGMFFIASGVFFTYVFTFTKIIGIFISVIARLCKKNQKAKNRTIGEEDLTKTHRGLIFYSEVYLSHPSTEFVDLSTPNPKSEPNDCFASLPDPNHRIDHPIDKLTIKSSRKPSNLILRQNSQNRDLINPEDENQPKGSNSKPEDGRIGDQNISFPRNNWNKIFQEIKKIDKLDSKKQPQDDFSSKFEAKNCENKSVFLRNSRKGRVC